MLCISKPQRFYISKRTACITQDIAEHKVHQVKKYMYISMETVRDRDGGLARITATIT